MKTPLIVSLLFIFLSTNAQTNHTFIAYITPQTSSEDLNLLTTKVSSLGVELKIYDQEYSEDHLLRSFRVSLETICQDVSAVHKNFIDFSAPKTGNMAAIFLDATCLSGSLTTSPQHIVGLENFLFKNEQPSLKMNVWRGNLDRDLIKKTQTIAIK